VGFPVEGNESPSEVLAQDRVLSFFRLGEVRLRLDTQRVVKVDLILYCTERRKRVVRTTDLLSGAVDTAEAKLLSEPLTEMEVLAWCAK
jgi:hypothetical protein